MVKYGKPDAMEMTALCPPLEQQNTQNITGGKGKLFNGYALFISGLLYVFSDLALAKELYVEPTASTRLEYDDNIRLLTDSGAAGGVNKPGGGVNKSAFGSITRFGGRLGARSDLYNIMLNNNFEIKRYVSDLDLDSENIYINLSSNFNVTQRNTFSLNGDYVRDTTLTSELDVTGLVLVQNNIIREVWSISPEWTFNLSNTQFLSANYNHYDVAYEESLGRFFDFTTDTISLSYIQQLTELLNTYLSVSAMTFDVPDIGRETTQYTVNVGGEYQFLPTWSASFSVGRRFTNTEITSSQPVQPLQFLGLDANGNPVFASEDVTVSDDVQGMVFSFSLDKQFETGSASVSFSRSISSQGNGRQQLFDKFIANYHQKITQNFAVSLSGGINDTTTSGSRQDFGNDRTYYHITPSVNWYFNRQAYINAGYRYRMQEFQSNSDKAVSNTVFISFTYQWDKLRTQRY